MPTQYRIALAIAALLSLSSCTERAAPSPTAPQDALVGAWKSQVRFAGGALAEMKDLEFMYVFNAGGTLTESSNYDGAPPVPPAYGVWRNVGPRQFEARYEFYVTKNPGSFDEIAKGGGWNPNGHGLLLEKLTLSEDGQSFTSTIEFTAFDPAGKPAEGGGKGTGSGTRMRF